MEKITEFSLKNLGTWTCPFCKEHMYHGYRDDFLFVEYNECLKCNFAKQISVSNHEGTLYYQNKIISIQELVKLINMKAFL